MGCELDKRDNSVNYVTESHTNKLLNRARLISDSLPGDRRIHIDQFDAVTGNAAAVSLEAGALEQGNFTQRALEFDQLISGSLGLEATQPVEFSPDPHESQTSSGAVTVYLRQHYKGIPIFQAAQTVRFDPGGSLTDAVGKSISVGEDTPVVTAFSAAEAVMAAARHVAAPTPNELNELDDFGQPLTSDPIDLVGFAPVQFIKLAHQADQVAYFEPSPFGDKIKAGLVWFSLSTEKLILSWEVLISLPGPTEQFRTLVDAQSGEIMFCEQLVKSAIGAGAVFIQDGSSARQTISFPRNWGDYELVVPADLPPLPDEWITTSHRTEGNSVLARFGDNGQPVSALSTDGVLTFDPSDNPSDQLVLNAFYYSCYMHDFFYLLGFRERDGNFQTSNFNRGGFGSDCVEARVHSVPVTGTANMKTSVDGRSPLMNLGIVARTNRHTALDASVVFHEFTHGVTNRLVGGPLDEYSLSSMQSEGMGEGWGDYIACTILKTEVIGAWLSTNPEEYADYRIPETFHIILIIWGKHPTSKSMLSVKYGAQRF